VPRNKENEFQRKGCQLSCAGYIDHLPPKYRRPMDWRRLFLIANRRFRSLIALPCTLLFCRYEDKRGLSTTQQSKLEYLRDVFLFLSHMAFMMGLAALPLADIEAIRFSGPLMITFLSVVMLGKKVGPCRCIAQVVGFIGILLIVKSGSANFNLGSIFILISVLFYALTAILTRKLQTNDSSATMSYTSSLVYLVAVFVLAPLSTIVGNLPNAHWSIAF
jgi:drug/metabolite transporter (DMT)-like permease